MKTRRENPWFEDESDTGLYFSVEANLNIHLVPDWGLPPMHEEDPPT